VSSAGRRAVVNSKHNVSDDDQSDRPKPAEPQTASDVVVIHGVTADGKGLQVLRARRGGIETGAVKPLEEGKPILGEVVRLHPHEACPLVCDVEVDVEASVQPDCEPQPALREQLDAASARKGPAQVASNAYRQNWDAIWSRPKKAALPN
jgi:hypothetical protein